MLRFLYPYLCPLLKAHSFEHLFLESQPMSHYLLSQGSCALKKCCQDPCTALPCPALCPLKHLSSAMLAWSDYLFQKKRAQICVPYSVFPDPFFSGCLSSHSEVLWARATCLEYSVSCGEWVKRPGDSIFFSSSCFVKFRQVTTRELLSCSHLLCSQTSSDGLEKYLFKKIQRTGH